jgi:hypothetical protein
LILIGHETGHFIQPLVQSDFAYVASFRKTVENAVTAADGTEQDADRWGGWAPEIFADWYSVLTMGPWAVWMMAQLELDEPERMLDARAEYPSPLARLALLAALADGLTAGAGSAILRELGLDWGAQKTAHPEASDLAWVETIAKAVRTSLPAGFSRWEDILFFRAADYEANDQVHRWSNALLADPEPVANKDLRAARHAAAGAGQACWQIMKTDEEAVQEKNMENLQRAAGLIAACAEPGKRAAVVAPKPKPNPGADLADLIDKLDATAARHALPISP